PRLTRMLRPPDQRLFTKSRRRVPSRARRWTSVRCARRTGGGYNTGVADVRGRGLALGGGWIEVWGAGGRVRLALGAAFDGAVGDLVVVSEGLARVVARARGSASWRRTLDPRRLAAMTVRDRVETGIREFFRGRGFLEVRTPVLVPCPGMEPHIR